MTNTTENNTLEPIIRATAIVITDNFDQLKGDLLEQIKLYEIEVTEENLSDAKKMATELNKLSTAINRIKIDKAKEFAAPIEEFKKKAAELIDIVQSGREKILKQVEAFDKKVLETVKTLLVVEIQTLLEELEVLPEFQTARIESMIVKSNLTAGGQLTKAAKDKLAEMAAADRSMQETVGSRLANLQAIAERAGLVCLPSSMVASFVRDPEAIYSEKLNKLIDSEINRQRELEEKIKAREAEKLAKQQQQQPEPATPATHCPAPQTIIQPPIAKACPAEPAKTFKAEFMGAISTGQTAEDIAAWLDVLESGESLIITKE